MHKRRILIHQRKPTRNSDTIFLTDKEALSILNESIEPSSSHEDLHPEALSGQKESQTFSVQKGSHTFGSQKGSQTFGSQKGSQSFGSQKGSHSSNSIKGNIGTLNSQKEQKERTVPQSEAGAKGCDVLFFADSEILQDNLVYPEEPMGDLDVIFFTDKKTLHSAKEYLLSQLENTEDFDIMFFTDKESLRNAQKNFNRDESSMDLDILYTVKEALSNLTGTNVVSQRAPSLNFDSIFSTYKEEKQNSNNQEKNVIVCRGTRSLHSRVYFSNKVLHC